MPTRTKQGKSSRTTGSAKKAGVKKTGAKKAGVKKAGSTGGTKAAKKTARRPVKRAAPRKALAFELRRSPIQGLGAFALRDIKKGERLIEYTGEKISHEEADRRYDDEKMKRHHTFLFTLDDKWILDAAVGGNEARFINHSCDPNCEAVIVDGKKIFIEAKKSIPAGTELVYDYQYERTDAHTPEDEKFYECRCGAPNCRGSILAPKKEPRARAGKGKRTATR